MTQDIIDKVGDGLLVFSQLLAAVIAAAVLCFQTYVWLRWGQWEDIAVVSLFTYFDFDLNYVYAPKDWHGIAGLASSILDLPVWFCVPLAIVAAGKATKSITNIS